MSVKQTKTVDFISINLDGDAVLTIADDLEWDEKNEHLLLLQDKLNSYLNFIESGEIYEQYPSAINRRIIVEIVAKYNTNDVAEDFIEKVKNGILSAGYGFKFRILSSWWFKETLD